MAGNRKELNDHGMKNPIDLNACSIFIFLIMKKNKAVHRDYFDRSLKPVTPGRSFPSRSSRLAPPKQT